MHELTTGSKGVPLDRTQRLVILSLREKRMIGKVRRTCWCDTRGMLANALTKHDATSRPLWDFIDSGWINLQVPLEGRTMRRVQSYSENDLIDFDIDKLQVVPKAESKYGLRLGI